MPFAAFLLASAVAAHAAPCTPAIGDRLRAQLSPWLEARAKAGEFSGVVVVACNGTPVYSVAYGMANRARKEPITLDSRFNLGSMNKMWTATAIAQLVEQGKVDVNAPVGRYLPQLTNASLRDSVLVRHLLTHTSGLGMYFKRGFLANRVYVNAMTDYLPFFIDDPLSFSPGSKFQYSNAGFAVLGMIVERVSGMPFYEYMQKNILDRAGVAHASYADLRARTADMVMGYAMPPGATQAEESAGMLEVHGGPAGGVYARASDVLAFSRALWNGTLIKAETRTEFTTGKIRMGGIMYAYGFGDGTLNGWRSVGHNGGAPGVGAEYFAFPEQGVDVITLTNVDMPVATQVQGRAARIITGENVPPT